MTHGAPSHVVRLPTVSLVIPCWNDADALRRLLPAATSISGVIETIVADSSENGVCEHVSNEFGATHLRCPKPNRGAQMNAGACIARGDVILFHHADTELRAEHIESVQKAALKPRFTSGAFYRRFDPAQKRRAWMEPFVRFYNRHFGALYGDQSLFISREHFVRTGGFQEIALMEDVEYTRRLRKHGITLVDPPVASNGRRLTKRGSIRVTLQNLMIMVLFRFGASPDWLHRWYYGKNVKRKT
jgi:GT2 family glycosyltransferase